ncbi:MAG: CDC27 family protein [Sulfurovaceae bacterium]|nr:CDC27 family protein [Sulfurovaceae bacterium]
MINTIALEKRWLRYKTRIFRTLFFILFFVLTIPYLSYYLFLQYSLIVDKDKNVSKIITHNEKLTAKDELAPKVEKNLIKEVSTSADINENINDVVLAPSIPIIDFNNEKRIDREIEQKKIEQKQVEEKEIEQSREAKERAYRKKVAKRRALERKRAEDVAKKKNLIKAKSSSSLSSSELKVVNGNDVKNKSSSSEKETKKINFKTTSSNYMGIMKKKFEQNKNPREAILIAKAYYKAGNYVESEKWALSANDLDKKSEESWFIFAKSKAKLGKRREALKILVSYYKKNKSAEAKELIEQIKAGSL